MNELYYRDDRRYAVQVGVPLAVLLLGIFTALLCYNIFWIIGWPLETKHLLSILSGMPLGMLGVFLMRLTWDSVWLRPTNPKAKRASVYSWVTPFAVIGGIICSRLMSTFLSPEQMILLGLGGSVMMIIFFSYLIIIVLIHHRRWIWR